MPIWSQCKARLQNLTDGRSDSLLYGFLDEIIYFEQPHLFELNPELVCRLRKALYGLKQAP